MRTPGTRPPRTLRLAVPLAIALTALMLSGCSGGTSPDPGGATTRSSARESPALASRPVSTAAGWSRVEGFPLSDRVDPVLAALGGELYVLGGNTGRICPPTADCVITPLSDLARDGAAYDPATGEWRLVADLPRGRWSTDYGTRPVVVDDLLLLADWRHRREGWRWVAYDPASDTWSDVPGLSAFPSRVATDGKTLWVLDGARVLTVDPRTGSSVQIGRYAGPRTVTGRTLLPGPDGPAIAGYVRGAAPYEPHLTAVDLLVGAGRVHSWRRLTTEQFGEIGHFTGEQFIGAEPGRADGGRTNNWGRSYDAGGAVDARTGAWTPLDVPAPTYGEGHDGWTFDAFDGTRLVSSGWYRDLADDEGWTRVGRPKTSDVDTQLTAVWVDEWLVVFGGVDLDGPRWEGPAPSEVLVWRPDSGA